MCNAEAHDVLSGELLLKCDRENSHDFHLDEIHQIEWRKPFSGAAITRVDTIPPRAEKYVGTPDPRVTVTIR